MGKKGKWLSNLKKAFSPNSKNKGQRSVQLKEEQQPKSNSNINFDNDRAAPPLPPELNDVKLVENTNEQNRQSYSVLPPAGAAEPSVSNAQITNEVDFAVNVCKFSGKSKEEVAAVMIQTAFRGYLARRALGALKGLMRLKSLMEGPAVKRQAANTLRCMQTVTRVQSQIYKRRIRMLEENQALQRQLLQKHAKELEAIRIGEEWDDSLQSGEQIQANLLSKYEAAMRRERALAYAFSHQQTLKSSLRAANPMFMNSGCPSWGWSWLERWTSAHPWDSHSKTGKEPHNNNHSSVKNASLSSLGGEISKSYARYQLNSEKLSLADGEKPLQKGSTSTPSKPASLPVARKLKSTSPRSSIGGPNDDSRSIVSVQSSVRERRHSIPGSSVRDDESLGSSHGVPSYMVPTKSAKTKSRSGTEKNGTPEKEIEPLESVKKRLSFPPSPARPRHHSRLPKLERNTEAIAVNNRSPANGKGI